MGSLSNTLWNRGLRPLFSRTKHTLLFYRTRLRRWLKRSLVRCVRWFVGGSAETICYVNEFDPLTPERIITAYVQGMFPIGDGNNSVGWYCPDTRGVIPSDQVHISKRLRGYLRKGRFEISFNRDFRQVMELCGDRERSWITPEIERNFCHLHERGFAHSVEAWLDGRLVGGGYGLAIGRMFFLESMFTREDHASKVAFVALATKLLEDGFEFIDCQYLSEHWRRFGAQPVERDEFIRMVTSGLGRPAVFSAQAPEILSVASA